MAGDRRGGIGGHGLGHVRDDRGIVPEVTRAVRAQPARRAPSQRGLVARKASDNGHGIERIAGSWSSSSVAAGLLAVGVADDGGRGLRGGDQVLLFLRDHRAAANGSSLVVLLGDAQDHRDGQSIQHEDLRRDDGQALVAGLDARAHVLGLEQTVVEVFVDRLDHFLHEHGGDDLLLVLLLEVLRGDDHVVESRLSSVAVDGRPLLAEVDRRHHHRLARRVREARLLALRLLRGLCSSWGGETGMVGAVVQGGRARRNVRSFDGAEEQEELVGHALVVEDVDEDLAVVLATGLHDKSRMRNHLDRLVVREFL